MRSVPLSEHCSYQIGGNADYYAEPKSREELVFLLDYCIRYSVPYYIFGLGSNILFPDQPKKGKLFISLKRYMEAEFKGSSLFVSSGMPLSFLALAGAIAGCDRLLFTYLLPGCVGAGIYINAKYFDWQMSQAVDTVYYIDLSDDVASVKAIRPQDCKFSYKHSIFQEKPWLIVGADILLPEVSHKSKNDIKSAFDYVAEGGSNLSSLEKFYSFFALETLQEKGILEKAPESFQNTVRDRTGKHHFDYPSCGSVFKNNYSFGTPMGVLIDRLNLKGTSHGGAMIAPHHGNIIINYNNAKAEDVLYLMDLVTESINREFGFVPEPELVIVRE
jgi:UDP-N-acetylmuramate dehydrogenase